jgi:hypothetical protein
VFLRVCFRGERVLVLVVFHYHICRPIGFISEGKLLDYVGVLVLGRIAGRWRGGVLKALDPGV